MHGRKNIKIRFEVDFTMALAYKFNTVIYEYPNRLKFLLNSKICNIP